MTDSARKEAAALIASYEEVRWRKHQLKLPSATAAIIRTPELLRRVKAIIDPRVSSKQQRDEGYSIENQVASGIEWARHMKLEDGEYLVIVGEATNQQAAPWKLGPTCRLSLISLTRSNRPIGVSPTLTG